MRRGRFANTRPEVHAAEISYLPWSSPVRRPEQDRPLVAVSVPDDTPPEPTAAHEESDPETGDEEA